MFERKNKKSKHHNYGVFAAKPNGLKQYTRVFTLALLAAVFIVGLGLAFKNHQKRQVKVEALTEVSSQIPGWWYQQYFGASVCAKDNCQPDADPDKDGLNNSQELYYHSDPLNAHTAGDKTMDDGDLVAHNFDPSKSGRMSFDEVSSEDNILGESLVFDQDIKKIINESVNLNSAVLPEISDSEIKLTHDNSKESVINYVTGTKQIFDKYFTKGLDTYLENAVKARDSGVVASVSAQMVRASNEIRSLSVPDDFVQIHKYTLQLLKLLPDVINVPSADAIDDEYSVAGNAWYDKTQAAFSIYQKMDLENIRLENKYQNAQ